MFLETVEFQWMLLVGFVVETPNSLPILDPAPGVAGLFATLEKNNGAVTPRSMGTGVFETMAPLTTVALEL